jgi:hypothetical protein
MFEAAPAASLRPGGRLQQPPAAVRSILAERPIVHSAATHNADLVTESEDLDKCYSFQNRTES